MHILIVFIFHFRGNILKVQIFFADLKYEYVEETVAYSVSVTMSMRSFIAHMMINVSIRII